MTLEEAELKYGKIVDGVWINEKDHMKVVLVPNSVSSLWANTASNSPTTKIYMNKDLEVPFFKALLLLGFNGLLNELKSFDGCFKIRNVRGRSTLSSHSYGISIDINAKENALGDKPKLSDSFVKCWKDAGFHWGGDFKRLDGMHFSLVDW